MADSPQLMGNLSPLLFVFYPNMNYLRSKQNQIAKEKKRVILKILIFLAVLFLILGQKNVRSFFTRAFLSVGRPIWHLGNGVSAKLVDLNLLFKTKKSLMNENDSLNDKINNLEAENLDRKTLFEENILLKDMLERKLETNLVLAIILSKPNAVPYDILVIDAGSLNGIKAEDKVFAYGNILIGQISEVYPKTSKVRLFSTAGQKTSVILGNKDIYLDMIGRGGGNFEITAPYDFEVIKGDNALYPDIYPYIVGVVEDIIFDPRDPFKKVLLRSPINFQELKFVGVEVE
jgi:cell shape-determining protein MreC